MRALRLILAWLLVGIPLAWGVTRSVQKARPLFAPPSTALPVPAAPTPPR